MVVLIRSYLFKGRWWWMNPVFTESLLKTILK